MGRRVFIGALLTVIPFVVGLFMFAGKSPSPALAFSFSHYQRESDYTLAVVEMRNTGSKAASYWGSAVDSPFYSLMIESDGHWRESGMGWCGLGAREVLLHPGEATKIRVLVTENTACKVGVRFRARTLRDLLPKLVLRRLPVKWQYPPVTRVAWSEPIRPERLR
jgi:hypothetical protein